MRAYERAVYIVELPEGKVEFRIGATPAGPAPDTSLAIITAWNPGTSRPSEAANESANRELEAALLDAGQHCYPACGRSEDGTHSEASFAIVDIDAASALSLAQEFRQAAIFYWNGRDARLLWCEA